jgi:hypothetical protein
MLRIYTKSINQKRRLRMAGACALALLAPLTMGATGLRTNMEERWLAAHNRERTDMGLRPLVWDAELQRDAKFYADYLAQTGTFEHADDGPGEPQGENLWGGTKGFYTPEAMVGLWIAEKKHYREGPIPSNSLTGRFQDVGHYTQLMWQSSLTIGCAMATGRRDDIMVCRYRDAGNVEGQIPF